MRKNILLFSYLAFFGSGCFSASYTSNEHLENKNATFFDQAKNSFIKHMSDQSNGEQICLKVFLML